MKHALIITESSVYSHPSGNLTVRGGGEMCLHSIGKALVAGGYEVTAWSLREFPDQKRVETIDGVKYVRARRHGKTSLRMFGYLWSAWRQARLADLVVVNQFTPHLLLPFLRRTKTLAVVHDVYLAKGRKFWRRSFGFFTGLFGALIERIQLFCDHRFADRVMTVSPAIRDQLVARWGPRATEKIFVNSNPVDVEAFSSERKMGKDFLLFVGRFIDYKHPTHVLEVLKRIRRPHPEMRAVFVASRVDPKCMREFERTRARLEVPSDSIEIRTDVARKDLIRLYQEASILVHPSEAEGQGIVILEALAAGTPVLAYDLPAYDGMIRSGENGVTVPIGDVEALAIGAEQVLENLEVFRGKTSEGLEKFSFEAFRERLLAEVD